MWLPRRPGNTCTHRLETIVIVGAEGDTRDPRSKMQRGFDSGNDTRGNWPDFARFRPHRIIPDRKFDRVFHVDEHIAHIFNYPISTVLFDRVK